MRKDKSYTDTWFTVEVLKEAIAATQAVAKGVDLSHHYLFLHHDDLSEWIYDTVEEFFADLRKYRKRAYFTVKFEKTSLSVSTSLTVSMWEDKASVSVEAAQRSAIETVFDVFERNREACRLPVEPIDNGPSVRPIVFIGHGRSQAWRDLKDHLHDMHGFAIKAYETGARAGHTIRDILEEMVGSSSFALLVFTGEDEQADKSLRARENVIHEAGLFQGRLGFPRALVLLEKGVEVPSNLHGVQHLPFAVNNIKEIYGEVVATLSREFPK
jgi:predicted nucleotide-binding protein